MGSIDVLEAAIREEAKKLIKRHQLYATRLAENVARRQVRTGTPVPKHVLSPAYWSINNGFNPYKTTSRARSIAHAIDKALREGRYTPHPAVVYQVPKGDGKLRDVAVFQVADNAISRMTFKTLVRKNAPRFSARCYAYRPDITLHDAIHYISREFRSSSKIFVAEFDFSEFFRKLSHKYIEAIINSDQFLITQREQRILLSFLRAPTVPVESYPNVPNHPTNPIRVNTEGIPQGTSVSLFLANIAASRLDSDLEGIGVRFARYADDTLIWSSDYSEVCRAVEILSDSAREMGVSINNHKSPGINLLRSSDENGAEFRHVDSVDFLGYRISRKSTSIKAAKVAKIKERISKIIYTNLLEAPIGGHITPSRFLADPDADYIVMIYQIRRYLYGDLSESRLARYLTATTPRLHYKGLMSFYPLVDDYELLKRLDGWMVHTIYTSIRSRARILRNLNYTPSSAPYGLSKDDLITLRRDVDLRIPSFVRIGALLKRASTVHGPNAVANVRSMHYYPR